LSERPLNPRKWVLLREIRGVVRTERHAIDEHATVLAAERDVFEADHMFATIGVAFEVDALPRPSRIDAIRDEVGRSDPVRIDILVEDGRATRRDERIAAIAEEFSSTRRQPDLLGEHLAARRGTPATEPGRAITHAQVAVERRRRIERRGTRCRVAVRT